MLLLASGGSPNICNESEKERRLNKEDGRLERLLVCMTINERKCFEELAIRMLCFLFFYFLLCVFGFVGTRRSFKGGLMKIEI